MKTHSFKTPGNCVNQAIILYVLFVCFATDEEEN